MAYPRRPSQIWRSQRSGESAPRLRPLGIGSACHLAAGAMLRGVRPQPFPSLAVLAEGLAAQPAPVLEGAAIEAAVLVCLHEDAVLLARRALHEDDPWSGHAGLPGGRWELGDESLLATALRETREEVGIDSLAHGRLLGALGTHVGRGRRVTGV